VLDRVPQVLQARAPAAERAALLRGVGHVVRVERTPILELLDVLEADHARAHDLGPAHDDPGETAHALGDGLAALGLREVLAVGRRPHQADRLAVGDGRGVHLEHVAAEVPGLRVVALVQADRLPVVVDGDVDVTAETVLDAGRGAAAACEQVDGDFARDGEDELRGQR
jgi:hypothetical protein